MTAPTQTSSPADAQRFDRRLISPMILGSILNPINSSIIAVALVPIGRAFGAPTAQTAWLVSGLYLATAIGQPVVGRLVDLFGPRRLLLAGAVLTGLSGLLGTLAPNLAVLVIARVVLGFGTCAGYPASMSLIRDEADRTGMGSPSGVLAALTISSQTIAVIGPTLGGLLIGLGGWRTTFALNIPLAIASFTVAALFAPRARRATEPRSSVGLDLAGVGLFSAMLVSLLLFLMEAGTSHLYLLAISAVAAGLLARREFRTTDPFLDLRLLGGNLPLLATYARMFLTMTVSYGVLYGYTQWLEDSHGLSAAQAGLLLVPMFVVGIVASATTGRRPEMWAKLVVGVCAQLAGCVLLLMLHGGSAIVLLVVVALVFGLPQGLNSLANQNAVYYQADAARLASSSGLLRTFTYLGAIVASALNGAFFGATADTAGLHDIAVFLIVASGLLLVLVLADPSLRRAPH
ncbi:MAG TPA: MFS transporter [Jatrophihabitans sp.]|jgi:MFS family permease